MDLADNINKKDGQPTLLASNATASLWLELQNSKRVVVKRPNPDAQDLLGFAKCWQDEHEILNRLSHPNILHFESQLPDGSQVSTQNYLISLADFMGDNPSFVAQRSEMSRIIKELIDVLDYLHQQWVFVTDLSPDSILLTRKEHTVKLFSVGSPYRNLHKRLWEKPSEFIAPELPNDDNPCNIRNEVYALGKVIEFMFFNGIMPYKYKAVVEQCLKTDPMLRYNDMASVTRMIFLRDKWNQLRYSLLLIIVIGLVVNWIMQQTTIQTETFHHVKPALNSDNTISVIEARQQYGMDDELFEYLNDSLITEEEWMVSDSLRGKLSDIFRRQFRQKAKIIMGKIYSKQQWNATTGALQINISQSYEELKQLKDQLVQVSGLDAMTADTIAAEVISELATEMLESPE